MRIIHVELREANVFVTQHHRHHKAVVGHKFSIGLVDEEEKLIGVAILGRVPHAGTNVRPQLKWESQS